MPLRLLIIEDHAMVREGLRPLLNQLDKNVTQHEAPDAAAALQLLEQEAEFDLALLDIMLPGTSGLALLGVLRKRYPAMPVVVLSALDDRETVERAMRQGAAGYVPKSGEGETLLCALRQVLAGEAYLPSHLQEALSTPLTRRRKPDNRYGITAGQHRVMELLQEGKSNREIGDLLGLTEGTVKAHVSKILRKLGVSSRAEAMALLPSHRSRG